jgi:hypothetical protein
MDTIFVSIASYRDSDLPHTIKSLYERAQFPDRVFVGVCQQIAAGDVDILDKIVTASYRDRVRVMTLPHTEARGPTKARHVIQSLYKDEMFVLQIDSHTRFVKDWDRLCIYELLQCPSEKPILSTFPADFEVKTPLRKPNLTQPIPFLGVLAYHERLGFVQSQRLAYKSSPSTPHAAALWSAGFHFTLGECFKQVPYDSDTPWLFLGEEIGMTVRFFTHGWDIFTPTQHIVFHSTNRTYRPVFWEHIYRQKNAPGSVDAAIRKVRKAEEKASVDRVTALIRGLLPKDDPFGLGTTRSIQEYEAFSGISVTGSRKCSERAKQGLTHSADQREVALKKQLRS